jgi:hypothetical protein
MRQRLAVGIVFALIRTAMMKRNLSMSKPIGIFGFQLNFKRGIILFMLLFITLHAAASTSGLYLEAAKLTNNIKMLNQYMGGEQARSSGTNFSDVSVREVYFQALRLQSKVNQLSIEIIGRGNQTGVSSLKEIGIDHSSAELLQIITQTNKQLEQVAKHLDIKLSERESSASGSLSSLFEQLLLDNNTVNALLERKTLPEDVYQIVSLSIHYAGEILAAMPQAEIKLFAAEYQANKRPADVNQQQIKLIKQLKQISSIVGLKMLTIGEAKQHGAPVVISPNYVQEKAYIVLAELSYLSRYLHVPTDHLRSFYPGKKFPSDVYQRNTLLLKQLIEIEKFLEMHPNWKASHDE